MSKKGAIRQAPKRPGPKILMLDIETKPILAYCWKIWDENIGINQIKSDWSVIAWAAKWAGDPVVMYQDQRHSKDLENDKELLKDIWTLLDEADVIVTQNGKRFDQKKLNARFVFHGMQPPRLPKHIDTREIAKRKFGFTSNKLEYMTDKLCTKYKKLVHRGDYTGFELWKACMSGDQKAWQSMEKYNKYDVLSLEELYTKLIPWDQSINFSLYYETDEIVCTCGSKEFVKRGFFFTPSGKFQRFRCKDCGQETRSKTNLFSKEKRASVRALIR